MAAACRRRGQSVRRHLGGSELTPFVEVTFQGVTVRTVSPPDLSSWQESSCFLSDLQATPRRAPVAGDTPTSPADEYVENAVNSGYGRPPTGGRDSFAGNETVTTRHYITTDIPVSAPIAPTGRRWSVLPLEQPPVLLGYTPAPGGVGTVAAPWEVG